MSGNGSSSQEVFKFLIEFTLESDLGIKSSSETRVQCLFNGTKQSTGLQKIFIVPDITLW